MTPLGEALILLELMSTLALHHQLVWTELNARQLLMHKAKHVTLYETGLILCDFVLVLQEQIRPKVARSVSPTSPSPLAADSEVKNVDDDLNQNAAPDEEMDELDAKEAAQFKADVQGHRHHEVGLACLFDLLRCASFSRFALSLCRRVLLRTKGIGGQGTLTCEVVSGDKFESRVYSAEMLGLINSVRTIPELPTKATLPVKNTSIFNIRYMLDVPKCANAAGCCFVRQLVW